ncbi:MULTISPECIES: hypothetical protein [unclassified Mucilaginibacter]|uniref:hypothetical protein n=1 Tax=unclassified Mucilaginibacter TaxID=2617802 RepID=UPI002AC8EFEC|nr:MULTISPECIES: hypothetical protein [unclassified Mucilaginibacter]MEB0262349.1 hypothetical protein [Mucilaginibacter sp. 10I4]MEB0279329.1 hypothetical protein [Mucilaginibacter sp. 10B2]MEB0302838.1 hypothetical protein [Mucilaginibacter sp. 5C4]WPX23159.1 hypothetical protein RHM67_17910 [Mucilaginibacter sp. 5C4]
MKKTLVLFTLLIINTVSYAQIINLCLGVDNEETCPLDTWVYLLVLAFIIFGVYKIQQKQKKLSV